MDRLQEQRLLVADPAYAPVVKRWKKDGDGSRVLSENVRRVKPLWRTDADGNVVLTVKKGLRTLEFEKGKAGISVGSMDRLDAVLVMLIAAVKAGELDALLEPDKGLASRRKKAA